MTIISFSRRGLPLLVCGLAALFSLSAFSSSAKATPSASDRAAAEALFDQAVKLLEGRRAAEACPKLEESQRLDPGVGTLLYLADCYQQVGRTASAWATFRDAAYAASAAGQPDREKIATEHANALKPKLSYLTLTVEAPNTPGLEILRDGEPVSAPLWSTPIPIDPGPHTLRASAPDRESWNQELAVPPGPGTVDITIPALAPATAAPTAPPPPIAPVSRSTTAADRGGSSGKTQRVLGWIAIGAGGLGILGSAAAAAAAVKDDKDADDHCLPSDPTLCSARGAELGDSATKKANLATGLFAAGSVLAATGLVLVITAKSDEPARTARLETRVTPGNVHLSLSGAW